MDVRCGGPSSIRALDFTHAVLGLNWPLASVGSCAVFISYVHIRRPSIELPQARYGILIPVCRRHFMEDIVVAEPLKLRGSPRVIDALCMMSA